MYSSDSILLFFPLAPSPSLFQVKAYYYTDNHEAPAVIEYRDGYLKRGREREVKSPEWVSMTIEYASKNYTHLLIHDPHNVHYFWSNNRSATPADMVEFHVDLDEDFFRGFFPSDHPPEYVR